MKIPKELIYITTFLACVIIVSVIIRQPEFSDKNCGDFNSRSEMLKEFKSHKTDIHRLDANHDGVPCQLLK